jgi:lipopolysaccharide biosynthesis regulator YciM
VEAEETLAKADLGAGLLDDAERLFLDLIKREPNECTHYLDLVTTLREMKRWPAVVDMAGKVTASGGPACERKEKAMGHTQAGFAWLKQDDENLPPERRRVLLNSAIEQSQKAIDMGSDGFATKNRDTARENLARMESNLDQLAMAKEQERQQCIECLKVFDFQQKTVAFLQETEQPDADSDGIADASDACPDTPPWTLVDTRGCTDPAKKECNDMLRKTWCQEEHGKE